MQLLSSRWFKVAVSLGLFVLLLRSTDSRAFTERLTGAQLEWVFLAFVGYLLGQALSAYKWQVLARPLGFAQPLRAFIAYYFAGMYLNLFAPSTIAGDFGRGALLAEERGRLGQALQSVVADRVSGLVMLLWVSAFGVLFTNTAIFPFIWRWSVIAAAVGATAGWWVFPRVLNCLLHGDNGIRLFFDKLIGPYRDEPDVLARACGFSLFFHVFQLGLQAMVAHALSLDVSLWYFMTCIPLINILSASRSVSAELAYARVGM